ncbi:MAG TPA: glycerate kinase [Acidimicrobiales bacterium]|nr:glycerate kinase [Acidimicrobiales bacterium]
MPHLVAAPDKFRGTATAGEVAAGAARAAAHHGWTADEAPVSDGGEGLLEAVGGEPRRTKVEGPLGATVDAEWRLIERAPDGVGPVAVVEMAMVAGLALAGGPEGNDPLRASTVGVGELIRGAVEAGARRVLVGLGGSATTDGGWGAVEVVGGAENLRGAELVVACDVTTRFEDAARVFGPQKGASPDQVVELTDRLVELAARYRRDYGVDVTGLAGSGAAGGLAGGLAALGGRLVPGFELVAAVIGLEQRLDGADLVVTGEGRLDATSMHGKVVGGVVAMVDGRCPVLCVVGEDTGEGRPDLGPSVEVVSLVAQHGVEAAHRRTAELVEAVVGERLDRW